MLDIMVIALCSAALLAAMLRQPDRVSTTLAIGYLSSLAARFLVFGDTFLLVNFAVDLGVIVALGEPYTQHPHKRAWCVSAVGAGKMIATAVMYGGNPYMSQFAYASALLAGFLAQVAISGGCLDAVGHWVDDHLQRFFPRRYRAFWHVAGR